MRLLARTSLLFVPWVLGCGDAGRDAAGCLSGEDRLAYEETPWEEAPGELLACTSWGYCVDDTGEVFSPVGDLVPPNIPGAPVQTLVLDDPLSTGRVFYAVGEDGVVQAAAHLDGSWVEVATLDGGGSVGLEGERTVILGRDVGLEIVGPGVVEEFSIDLSSAPTAAAMRTWTTAVVQLTDGSMLQYDLESRALSPMAPPPGETIHLASDDGPVTAVNSAGELHLLGETQWVRVDTTALGPARVRAAVAGPDRLWALDEDQCVWEWTDEMAGLVGCGPEVGEVLLVVAGAWTEEHGCSDRASFTVFGTLGSNMRAVVESHSAEGSCCVSPNSV